MATEIKRYEFQPATKLSNSTIVSGVEYYLDPSGRWVRYADHEAKVRALEELKARLILALRGLWDRHNDGSEEEFWAEWDTADNLLCELGILKPTAAFLNPSTKKGSSHE